MTDILKVGSEQLGVDLSLQQLMALDQYVALLIKWNKVYSLTSITAKEQIIVYHLLDGISLIPQLKRVNNILDVGSGMGVPGVIVAIACPEIAVTVLDSNSKKSAFLRQLKIELGLSNLTVVNRRVEEYLYPQGYAVITSRAFADLSLFVGLTQHLLAKSGYYLAMKSTKAYAEVDQVEGYTINFSEITVPFLQAPRVLVKMTQQ